MRKTTNRAVGDFLTFEDLAEIYKVTGMETWDGDMIADSFNKNNEMQIEYTEDSFWRITALTSI